MRDAVNNFILCDRYRAVDQSLNELFSSGAASALVSNPRSRHELYALLFEGLGTYTPGITVEQLREELRRDLGADHWGLFAVAQRQLTDVLRGLLGTTYSVASYLGPGSGNRRQSAVHRPPSDNPEERKRTLAFTYAFYDLTLKGRSTSYNLYSATQFILERAARKWSLPLCFEDALPGDSREWWHIPQWLDRPLLEDSGLLDAINRDILREGATSESALAQLVWLFLANTDDASLVDQGEFAATWLERFSRGLPATTSALGAYLDITCDQLTSMFGVAVDRTAALFMLATYTLWRRAYPETLFAYTFPTLVRNHPCVLTVGTRKPLEPASMQLLAYVGSAAFVHPLIADYSAQELRWVATNPAT